jgi:cytochrome P450
VKVDFRDPSFRSNPDAILSRLRMECPVAPVKGLPSFLVTRHQDCSAILTSKRFGFEDSSSLSESKPDYGFMRRSMMVFQNSPNHQKARLEGRRMLRRESPDKVVEEAAHEVIDRWTQRKGPLDSVSNLARPFTWRIAERILEGEIGDPDKFQETMWQLARSMDPLAAGNSVTKAGGFYRLLEGMIEHSGCPAGGQVEPFLMLMMASTFTTNHILGLVIEALLRDEEGRSLLRNGWNVDEAAVEELFRICSPVQMTRRVALQEVEVAGKEYPSGTVFWLSLRSANFDEDIFEVAGRLRLDRSHNPHLAFGKGVHNCLGADLARLQLRTFLNTFAGREPELALSKEKAVGLDHLVFRGFQRLLLEKEC